MNEGPRNMGHGAERPRDPNDVPDKPLGKLVQELRERADNEHELKRILKKMQE